MWTCVMLKKIMNKHPPHLLGTQNLPTHMKTYDSPETLGRNIGKSLGILLESAPKK